MTTKTIKSTPNAYNYPLLIKNILNTPLIYSPDQEIVYRDNLRYTYTEFNKRVKRLANMLESLGVKPGDTVGVMDWDSHRYLECFFAIPMMGAVLHTINIRLTSEQLIYTINHAEDDVILVNDEFVSLLESVKDKFETVKQVVLLSDKSSPTESSLDFAGEYEHMISDSTDEYIFPDFDENTTATTFYTTGTTGLPKAVFSYNYGSYKGYFAENIVLTELISHWNKPVYSWNQNTSEIEFLMDYEDDIIPIEVKARINTKAKSLKIYKERYSPKTSILLSGRPMLRSINKTMQLPLYAASKFQFLIYSSSQKYVPKKE